MTAPRTVDTESPVLFTSGVARLLRMRTGATVRWLVQHGVNPLPDCGHRRRWSRAAVMAAIEHGGRSDVGRAS